MKIIIFLIFVSFSIPINAQYRNFWKPVDQEFHFLLNEIDSSYLVRPNTKNQKEIVSEMYRLAEKRKNPVLLSRALQWDAVNKLYILENDSADKLLEKASSLIDTLKYSYDYARIKGLKEKFLKNQGNYQHAYKINVELLEYYRKIGDKRSEAMTLVQMGSTMYFLKDYEKSKELLEEANSILTNIGMESIAQKNKLNICNTLFAQGNTKAAIDGLDELLQNKNPDIAQDTVFILNVMFSQCSFAPDLHHLKKYAGKNYELAKKFKNKTLESKAGISYAFLLIEQKKYDQAIALLDSINKYVKNSHDMNNRLYMYKNKLFAYSRQEIWDSAYYYSELFYNLNDSIVSIGKIIEINKIEAREAINKFEQEKKESELRRRNALMLLFGVCCLSAGLISIIYFRNKKIKVQKQLKEVENKELNERLKNELLQKENLKLEIDSKNREIASNTLMLAEKNRLLENLAQQINDLEFKGEINSKKEKELQKQIQNHLHAADEWNYFKIHFEQVHPDFFSKIKEHSPSISENDLRLCAYIRIGMENKQIAQMLSVLPATINTSRYRIRKKLNIVGDIPLEDFLRSL